MNSVSHISFRESLTMAFKSSVAIITLARGRWRLTCFDMRKLPPIDARTHACKVVHAVILLRVKTRGYGIDLIDGTENAIQLGHENKWY